jgi:hypothetical protein
MRKLHRKLNSVRKGAVSDEGNAVADAVAVDACSLPPSIACAFESKLLLSAI